MENDRFEQRGQIPREDYAESRENRHMKYERNRGRIGRAAIDLRVYASLWIDSFRLGLIDNLSALFSTLFGVISLLIFLGMAITFFAVGFTWLLGEWIGSLLGAIFIMGGVMTFLAIVMFSLRKTLVLNPSIRMLSRMIYDLSQKYNEDEKS